MPAMAETEAVIIITSKRAFTFAIAVIMILSLTACGKEAAPSTTPGNDTNDRPTTSQTPSATGKPSDIFASGEPVALMDFAENLPDGYTMYTAQQVHFPQNQAAYSNEAVRITVEADDSFNSTDNKTLRSVTIVVSCKLDSGAPSIGLELCEVEDFAIVGDGYTADLATFLYEMMDNMGDEGISSILGLSGDGLQALSDEVVGPDDALTMATIVILGNEKRADAFNFDSRDKSLGEVGGFTFDGAAPIYLSQDILQEILDLLLQI
jgi:predicted small lipoprotein YifL